MKKNSLSWVIGVGNKAEGGSKDLPAWSDVDFYLGVIEKRNGSLTLSVFDGPSVGPQLLQVFSDEGRYVLSLGEDDGVDYIVRSYFNSELQGSEYEVLGDVWSGELVCLDFAVVREAFEDFLLKGDVGRSVLS